MPVTFVRYTETSPLAEEKGAVVPIIAPRLEFIATILQNVLLNLGLLTLGLITVVFLGKETVHLADALFVPEQASKYELVEGLVIYFLYFGTLR